MNYFELLGLPFDGSLENVRKSKTGALDKMIDSAVMAWREKLIAEKVRCSDKARIAEIESQLAREDELRRAMLARENGSTEGMIEEKIKKWKSRLESEKAGGAAAGDPVRRAQIDAELALEADIRAVMLDKKSRRSEANDMIDKSCEKLSKLLDIQMYGLDELPDVTEGQVRSVANRLGLPPDKAREVYTSKGIKIVKPRKAADLKKYFLDDATFNNLKKLFARLHEDKWIKGTQYESAAAADDLYSLACLLDGGRENDTAVYRKKPTKTLKDIMDKFSVKLASDSGSRSYAAILRDLVSIGSSRVFDSEEDREKYAHSMQKEELSEFFTLLRQAPPDFKKDKDFAENCIKRIQTHFPDYSIALALYNEKAGLGRDPYVRQDTMVGVVCDACGSYSEYQTAAQAQKSVCPACGAALYISCPSCGKKVPASADRCGCGFGISEIKHIGSYVTGAESAIGRLDFKEAEYFISNIERIEPKNSSLPRLKKQYDEKKAVYKKPLAELDALIQSKRFVAAQQKVSELSVNMKELDLDSRRESINERIESARKALPKGSMSDTERGNRCYDALSICADLDEALEMIGSVKLSKVKELTVSVTDGACELMWQRSQDRGVSYRIVRKQGAMPASVFDGEVIASQISLLSFTDKTMLYGVKYGYAVFCERMGVFSEPAAVWAEALGELDRTLLTYSMTAGKCTFGWTLPANALGVRVIKKEGAPAPETPDKLCTVWEHIKDMGFTDDDVQNGVTYGYRLQCIYAGSSGHRYSKGTALSLRPEPLPQEIEGLTVKHKGEAFEVRWKNTDSTQKICILRLENADVFMDEGDVCGVSELESRVGTYETLIIADMSAGRCGVTLEKNRMQHLAVVTRSGASVRLCRVMSVSTAAPVVIDPVNTVIKNNKLTIKLKSLPDGLKRIHYCALTKTDSTVPWADISDIGTAKLISLSAEDVSAGITFDVPQEDIYITVIGEYDAGGKAIYSEPCRLKRNNSPRARISYKLVNSLIGDKHTLRIKADCEQLPEMYLVYSRSGVPTDITSGDTVTVMTLGGGNNTSSKGYTDTLLPKEVWDSIPSGVKIRLLIDKADTFDYEMSPKEVASLKK